MAPCGPTVVASMTVPQLDTVVAKCRDQAVFDQPLERFFSAKEEFFSADPNNLNEVHPLHAAAKPSLDDFRNAASAPVIMTSNPIVPQQVRRVRKTTNLCVHVPPKFCMLKQPSARSSPQCQRPSLLRNHVQPQSSPRLPRSRSSALRRCSEMTPLTPGPTPSEMFAAAARQRKCRLHPAAAHQYRSHGY